eukprot:3560901-Karenia_brevis.AAC.1
MAPRADIVHLLAGRDGRVDADHASKRLQVPHVIEQWRNALPLSTLLASGDGRVEVKHIKQKAPTLASHGTTAPHAATGHPFRKLRWLR